MEKAVPDSDEIGIRLVEGGDIEPALMLLLLFTGNSGLSVQLFKICVLENELLEDVTGIDAISNVAEILSLD